MKSSILYQVLNVASGVVVLALVLVHLNLDQYLQWVLFSTIGGVAIQVESSVSAISSRHLSRHLRVGFRAAVRRVALLYRRFSINLFITMILIGGSYLASVDKNRFSSSWHFEWLLMCAGYLGTYLFAHNYCILIAQGRVGRFAGVGVTSRLCSVALSFLLLALGLGVMGLSIAFLASAVLGSLLYRIAVAPAMTSVLGGRDSLAGSASAESTLRISHVVYHCLFMSVAYALYRYGLLILAIDPTDTTLAASYGLAMQLITLISAVAIAPVNLRIAPMIAAIQEGDRRAILQELTLSLLVANAIYIAGVIGVMLCGPQLLQALPGIDVTLPRMDWFLLLAVAGLVEINILVFVNVLVGAQRFGFVGIYVSACCGYWLFGGLIFLWGREFLPVYVGSVACLQAGLVLPLIVRLVAGHLGLGGLGLLSMLVRDAVNFLGRMAGKVA